MPKGPRGTRGAGWDHNYATRKLYDKRHPANREFRGVDGEGGNVPDSRLLFGDRHQYLSLRAGPDLLETGRPLEWEECFAFLAGLSPNYNYVAYFFDYDVTMMIRTLPEDVAKKLLNRSLRVLESLNGQQYRGITFNPAPVSYGGFEFDYLPHKEFKIRREGTRRWVVINDVGQFFQSAFLTTLDKWDIGSLDERSVISKGKSMRASFTMFDDEIRYYNALECVLLEQLMTNFRAVCEEVGYVPKKWQGPGHLASAMLLAHGVPKRDDVPILKNRDFRDLAQAAYYGGRFETTVAGPVPGCVWQYDINGAYVHLLKTLPCLIHGTWRWVHDAPAGGSIWFGEVHFDHVPAKRYLYNLPIRMKNGNIHYPKEGNGVYWSTELEAAARAGTRWAFRNGWVYKSDCQCRWFDWVDSYYTRRLSLGKSAKGYVLKLGGNSIYGKLAQSIGYAPWANPVWAGLITAGCRAMLIDAYNQAPDECYMLATDGIFMGTRLDLPISSHLGEWEETVHPDGIFIVQPGIYFMGAEAKTRGVERGRIYDMRPEFEAQFQRFMESHGLDHTVSVDVDNFITAKVALMRHKWEIAGTWEHTTRDISYSWAAKRVSGIAFNRDGMLRSVPYPGAPGLHSVSYGRIIGGGLVVDEASRYDDPGLQEAQRLAGLPDYVQPVL